MYIHVRPEPKNAEECFARVREQREKIFGTQPRPQPQPQPPQHIPTPEPEPAPEPEPEPIIAPPRIERDETPKEHRSRLIAETADRHGVSLDEMIGQDNRPYIVTARDEAIAAVKAAYPKRSNTLVGRDFGGRHPSTITIAMRRATKVPTGKERPRKEVHEGLDRRRLSAALRSDLMAVLRDDGLKSREIAAIMECTPDNARRVTRKHESQTAPVSQAPPAAEPEQAPPVAEPEMIQQPVPDHPVPAPSFFRQLLSRARAIMGH